MLRIFLKPVKIGLQRRALQIIMGLLTCHMMKQESFPPIHIKMLNLLGAIRDLSPFDMMTAEDEKLLKNLLVRWHEDKDISVGEVMSSMTEVSAATAYRRIISLRDKGLVKLRVDKTDKRVKFVDPTALALDYGNRIHMAIEGLVNESGSR